MPAVFPPIAELKPQIDLPDPLKMFDGRPVVTREQWEQDRKPELRALFQHYMYGVFPPTPPVEARLEREDSGALGGKAVLREVTLRHLPGCRPIRLLLVIPARHPQPAPAFVGLAFCGNQAVLSDPGIRMAEGWMYDGPGIENHRATEASRGAAVDVWNVEKSIDRGYAVAVFYNGDVEPDVPSSPEGIRAHLRSKGAAGSDEYGAIAAWAWGIHRVVDYLTTVPEIDSGRIAAVGHSRNGKAAMLAAAFDERIALAILLQAGCGGTAPSRGTIGESVRRINESFPHWFNETFKEFNDRPELLPFDQHGLVALTAPRPVLFANATEDTWANPEGQLEVLRAANPAYRLLGAEGIHADRMPDPGTLIPSQLGYFLRPGPHSMTTVDWQAFLNFADTHLRI